MEELASPMRVIDREQTKVVGGFGSTTRVNARLLALTQAGLLRRFFTGTISGGRKAVYTLSDKGAAFVGAPFQALHRKPDETLIDPFVEHQLRINDMYLTVKYRPIPIVGAALRRWTVSYKPLSTMVPVTPDAYIEFETPAGIQPMFLEVDLGTEPLKVWHAKTQLYLQLAITGEFERLFSQKRFRVLVIVPSEKRLTNVRATIGRLTEKIFWLSTFESISREGFWSPIWLRPTGEQKQSLL